MKTFKWVLSKPNHPFGGEFQHTLLEVIGKSPETIRFWAVLNPIENGYNPVIFKKRRNGHDTILDVLDLEESRLQVEKRLMEYGVMQEGDEVIYEEKQTEKNGHV